MCEIKIQVSDVSPMQIIRVAGYDAARERYWALQSEHPWYTYMSLTILGDSPRRILEHRR